MQEVDEELITDFAQNFLGFGPLGSNVWFIGAEPGGGENKQEHVSRFKAWTDRGRNETEDVRGYHKDVGIDWGKNIQGTWGALSRVLLSFRGEGVVSAARVMEAQKDDLGKTFSVYELSALSSRSSKDWNFNEFDIEWLASRDIYEKMFLPGRCKLFQQKIRDHRPKLVVFHGKSHCKWWEEIVAHQFAPTHLKHLSIARSQSTLFAIMPHKNGIRLKGAGALNAFLAEAGELLRKEMI